MKRSHLVALSLALLLPAACGGSVAASPDDSGAQDGGADAPIAIDTGTAIDTGPGFDAPPGFDASPGGCNDLANIGGIVDVTNVPAPMPTLAGAPSIPTGTYVLVANELYTGAGGAAGKTGGTLRETISVTPGIVQSVISQDGKPDQASTTAYTIVGSTLHVTATCGASSDTSPAPDLAFDVSGSRLRIGVSVSGLSVMVTFQKK